MTSSALESLPLPALRRIGQALWMCIGESLRRDDLIWSRPLLGHDGPERLHAALHRAGALTGPEERLCPTRLASFLAVLAGTQPTDDHAALVWTLPPALGHSESDGAYLDAAMQIIGTAVASVWLVSPFLEARGVGRLLETLGQALARGVHVQMVTHDTVSIAQQASKAIEQLRREASSAGGVLTVFTVDPNAALLVHSKLIVADEISAVVGSANLTDRGLSHNFEAGVVLGRRYAGEICTMLTRLVQSGLVSKTFSTIG